MGDENLFNTSWTMDKAYLFRLDKLFQYANIKSINEDYGNWLKTLNALYRELIPKIQEKIRDKDFIKEIEKQKETCNNKYKIYKNSLKNIKNSRISAEGSQIPSMMEHLDRFDEILHIATNKAKLLMRENDDPSKALR